MFPLRRGHPVRDCPYEEEDVSEAFDLLRKKKTTKHPKPKPKDKANNTARWRDSFAAAAVSSGSSSTSCSESDEDDDTEDFHVANLCKAREKKLIKNGMHPRKAAIEAAKFARNLRNL